MLPKNALPAVRLYLIMRIAAQGFPFGGEAGYDPLLAKEEVRVHFAAYEPSDLDALFEYLIELVQSCVRIATVQLERRDTDAEVKAGIAGQLAAIGGVKSSEVVVCVLFHLAEIRAKL